MQVLNQQTKELHWVEGMRVKAFTKEKEEIHNQLMKTELYIQYKIACKNEKDLYYKIEEIKKSIKKV